MSISELYCINPIVVRSHQTAVEIANILIKQNADGVQVINDSGKILGYITSKHLLQLIALELPYQTPIEELLTIDLQPSRSQAKLNVPTPVVAHETSVEEKSMSQPPIITKQFIVHSKCMQELIQTAIRIAKVDSTVLIQGESGVGKELIADLIHANGMRRNGPLIKINCGAIPENLLESEFFGYKPGAFSGASRKGKIGLFELANGGILFLDEIGDMPLNLQVKLLRVIQDKEITRVGGVQPIKVDIRILTGTNRNLSEMIRKGMFRQDLYYRLNVVPIHVPPLRERREDIPVLTNYFMDYFNKKYLTNSCRKQIVPEVIDCFMEYDWPGNVRELENLIERLIVTTASPIITTGDLPLNLTNSHISQLDTDVNMTLKDAVEDTERKLIQNAYSRYKSTYEIAQVLEVNQSTVVRKAAKYGISRS